MHQRIGVRDDEQDRRQNEKRYEWQINIEKWKFDCVFEQKIAMGDAARRDAYVEECEKITEPQRAADRGCVLDTFAERVEVMRFIRQFRY
jgi:hypothetical protein